MRITKLERAVINEIEKIMLKHNPFITTNPEMNRELARWHLAKLKEARADGYMDAVLKKGKK